MDLTELFPQTPSAICKPGSNFVPVCATVAYETPECVYLNVDPDIWKIQCRQCQQKSDHRCALKRLKQKIFCGERKTKPREVKLPEIKIRTRPTKEEKKPRDDKVLAPKSPNSAEGEDEEQEEEEEGEEENEEDMEYFKSRYDDDYDNWCHCKTAPKGKAPKRKVCRCEKYKPVNFLFQLEVTGEYKPEYVPKKKRSS